MTAQRILDRLDNSTAKDDEAIQAARTGFLEWALSDGDAPAAARARAALDSPEAQQATSPSALLFLAYLTQATCTRVQRRSKSLH